MNNNRRKPTFENLNSRLLLDGQGLIDLEVSVTPDRETSFEGSNIVYTVAVTNNAENATTAATGVVLATDFSSGLGHSIRDASGATEFSTALLGLRILDPIEPGETFTIEYNAHIGSVLSDQMSLWVDVLEADQTDFDSTPGWLSPGGEDDSASGSVLYESPVYLGSIRGNVYLDADNDGEFDANELPLPGVEVIVTGVDYQGTTIPSETVLTDVNGKFHVGDLQGGTYTITQTQPTEFQDGKDTTGYGFEPDSNDSMTRDIDVGSEHSITELYSWSGNLFGELSFNSLPMLRNSQNSFTNANADGPDYYEIDLDGKPAFLNIEAANGIVRVVDENLNLVATHEGGGDDGRIALNVPDGNTGRFFVQVTGDDAIPNLSLDVFIPNVEMAASNAIIAVATMGDDTIELTLGESVHELDINGLKYEYDANVIDTFYVSGAKGDDEIIVNGTDADDNGSVVGYKGRFTSDAYHVRTYSAETTTYNGGGGNDRAQLFGSLDDDTFESGAQTSKMVTPTHVYNALGFERVDGYGRAGNDTAELLSTEGRDAFASTENYTWLRSTERVSTTKGFERVEVIGHGLNDVAHFHGTDEDDSFISHHAYSELITANRSSVVNHIDGVSQASVFLKGGTDSADFYELDNDSGFFAAEHQMYLARANFFNSGTGVQSVELVSVNELDEDARPRKQLLAAIDFALTENVTWI